MNADGSVGVELSGRLGCGDRVNGGIGRIIICG
jgi:hypothetical protein